MNGGRDAKWGGVYVIFKKVTTIFFLRERFLKFADTSSSVNSEVCVTDHLAVI